MTPHFTSFPDTRTAVLTLLEADGTASLVRHYSHIPTRREVADDINAYVNSLTDAKIQNGFQWQGQPVYLSTENQFNFKAAYDLAVQTAGATLPVTFKLGEDAGGTPVYHRFESLAELQDFYVSAIAFINQALNEGWAQKDAATDWAQSLNI